MRPTDPCTNEPLLSSGVLLLEKVLVDLDDLYGLFDLDAHAVADHERSEAGAFDEYNPGGDGLRVVAGAAAESGGGDEHSLVGLVAVECPDEGLDFGSADRRIECVAFRLDVYATEAGVLQAEHSGV